jgi:hypothetical protein
MWCGRCYTSSESVKFPVKKKALDEYEDMEDPNERERLTVAWGKKHQSEDEFHFGRNGDHCMVPFECDTCIFRKLQRRSPDVTSPTDDLLLACIRRVNLDAFWSRSKDTVRGNKEKIALSLKFSEAVGLSGSYTVDGALPDFDHCGYEVAINIVLYSRRPGAHSNEYTQFDTVRKLRTAYSNHCRSTAQANRSSWSIGDTKGKYQRLGTDPCGSFWFYRFMEGMKRRMGQDWRPNKAISKTLMLRVLKEAEVRIDGATSPAELNRWIVFNTYATVCYVVSLRGSEGLLLDLGGLNRKWGVGREKYVVIALLGKIKGETGDRAHLLPCVVKTSSGIKVRMVLKRLLDFKRSVGQVNGPAISDLKGKILDSRALNDAFLEILEDLFESARDLFPASIGDIETLRKRIHVFRTLRRTSDSIAIEEKVAQADIDVVNRWQAVEKAAGSRPNRPMRQHYAELELLLKPFLRYAWAM